MPSSRCSSCASRPKRRPARSGTDRFWHINGVYTRKEAAMSRIALMLAAVLAVAPAFAQPGASPAPSTGRPEPLVLEGRVQAVDHTRRILILEERDDRVDVIHVGPEVSNFGEVRAGDRVSVRYEDAHAVAIRPIQAPARRGS